MESFDYNDVFMGVTEGKPSSYRRSFKQDYRLKRLTEAIKKEEFKLLDIGCGGGITVEGLHYYYPKAKLYGCDVSSEAIKYAKKFGSGRVKYSVIKNKKLPYKTNFFDVCICLDVMEHIPDVPFFLREVKRILKPNGRFYLVVPCEGEPYTHTWLWQKIGIGNGMTYRRYGHIHPEFTHNYIEKLLVKHGFKISKKAYSEHFFYQLISVVMYFFPLEIMHAILGKNANLYTDSGVVRHGKYKDKKDPIVLFRGAWYGVTNFLRAITAWEIDLMKNSKFGSWKSNILAVSNKRDGKYTK